MSRGGRASWAAAAWAVAAGVVAPLAIVASSVLTPRSEVWAHLAATILPELTRNTLWLVASVAVLSGMLGTGLAWLVVMHGFPGRRFFEWALVLPLVVPAYVTGFVWIALFDFAGPVQTWSRSHLGGAALPDVRSPWAALIVLSLALYPYTYLVARAAFASLSASAVEAAQSLGASRLRVFWSVALPLARPAIAGGMTLAALETLSDFGTVSLFDVRTYTVGIYRVWFGMFDPTAASQLASLLLVFAAMLLVGERLLRGRRRFVQTSGRPAAAVWTPLGSWGQVAATSACLAVMLAAFGIPIAVLGAWSLSPGLARVRPLAEPAAHSLLLSASAALLAACAALVLAYARRLSRTRHVRVAVGAASLGYAMPGAVVAVGVLAVAAGVDTCVERLAAALNAPAPALVAGSVVGLLAAYLVRFIAVALQPLDAGLGRVPRTLDEAAASLGARPARIVRRVHLPLISAPLAGALLLVFMDVIKELPATMLMRPLGWDTLAVEVWQLTTESLWREAALPSLAIVAAGLPAAAILIRWSGFAEWQR